ncbi:MAG: hypothetical protein AAGA20_09300 [Planctomycetota bacterium]
MIAPPLRSRSRGGFTLLEVLLAAGLLVAGMSMILGVFNFGSALTRTAELRSVTAGGVEALIHDLEENLFELRDDGTAGPPQVIDDRPVPGRPGVLYSVEAVGNPETIAADGLPMEYVVDVSVRWQAAGINRSETWTTIMLREVPFGARMRRRFVR